MKLNSSFAHLSFEVHYISLPQKARKLSILPYFLWVLLQRQIIFLTPETTQNQSMVLRRTKTFLKIIKIITNFPLLTPQIQSNTLSPPLQNNDILILPQFFHNIKPKQSLFSFSFLNNHCIEKDLKRLKYICRLQSFFCCSCLIIHMSL